MTGDPGDLDGHVTGSGPWIVFMKWQDLLFAHWRIPVDELRRLVPAPFEVETFDGSGWLAVVPFRMARVHPRLLPPVSVVSDFPEINVRTYVTYRGRPGVWFFSLDADDRAAVMLGRHAFRLPYVRAEMSVEERTDGWFDYRSRRIDGDAPKASLRGRYRPRPDLPAPDDELTRWLTRRDGLWSLDRRGRPLWTGIRHPVWPLQAAEAELEDVSLVAADGLAIEGPPVHLAFSRSVDVQGWRPMRMTP